MTLDSRIAVLLAEAEPLRCLDDDDPAKERLNVLVLQVNALRERQANGWLLTEPEPEQRRPGRPRKAA